MASRFMYLRFPRSELRTNDENATFRLAHSCLINSKWASVSRKDLMIDRVSLHLVMFKEGFVLIA
jgi:hypothetical protein